MTCYSYSTDDECSGSASENRQFGSNQGHMVLGYSALCHRSPISVPRSSLNGVAHHRLTILHEMADPLESGSGMQTAAGEPDDYLRMKLVQLNNSVLSIFSGEKELKDEQTRKFWNPKFNHTVEVKDIPEHDMRIERHSSSKALLVDHMEVVENTKAPVALDLWLGWIAASL